jgi:septal ring factor EnvC (AmiA/AmiB activator)
VTDRPRATVPLLLIAASLAFAALLLYVLFAGYIPAKQRAARLEAELKTLYAREAQLQTQLVQQEQRQMAREQRLRALNAELDTLARRLEDLQRELAAARTRPARRR